MRGPSTRPAARAPAHLRVERPRERVLPPLARVARQPVVDGDLDDLINALQNFDYEARIENLLKKQKA